MLTLSQHLSHVVSIHSFKKLILGNRRITVYDIASNSAISVGNVWKNYPWTHTVQESLCLVGPRDFNIQLKGAACFCTFQTSEPVSIRGKHILGENSEMWLQSQSSPTWNGIRRNLHHPLIQNTSVSWQDHWKCAVTQKEWFILICSTWY